MSNLEFQNRMRINATLRMGTQRQAVKSNEPKVGLEKLEIKLPKSLQKQPLAPKIDPLLRPLQTNTRQRPLQEQMEPHGIPQIDPLLKKPQRGTRKEYKLVEDKDIPPVLKDVRHNIAYKKLNCLGSVRK